MKKLRILTLVLVVVSLFTLTANAVAFTPSIERKDGPVLVEGDDELIFTPVSELYKDPVTVHGDIKDSLTDARDELKASGWQDLIPNFEEVWNKYTGGAPKEHAIVSDIFDVRYKSELDTDGAGKDVTFSVTIQGLTTDDLFFIIMKEEGSDTWKVIEYTMGKDNVLTVTGKSKAVYAIVRDNKAPAPVQPDDPDSPQTAVQPYLVPAVIGAAVFAGAAVFCIVKLSRRRTA